MTCLSYVGDFNNANMTNLYVVGDPTSRIEYHPYFAAAGFRYAQLSGLPQNFRGNVSMLLKATSPEALTYE